MKIRPIFAWYDFWVGIYYDRKHGILYILPLPCIGVVVSFTRPNPVEPITMRSFKCSECKNLISGQGFHNRYSFWHYLCEKCSDKQWEED